MSAPGVSRSAAGLRPRTVHPWWRRAGVTACTVLLALGAAGCRAGEGSWPAWQAFQERFVQDGGRVVDLTSDGRSTSEGQSYGLFFALVAGDRTGFDRMLRWTGDHLGGGVLGDRLPAWLWGRRADGSWGIKDGNAAADSDLWLSYDLLEAGRLWHQPRYRAMGQRLLEQVRAREVRSAGSAGTVLLPAPYGFEPAPGRFRLVTSYTPGFLLQRLALEQPDGPWRAIWSTFLALAPKVLPRGVAPDGFTLANGRITFETERRIGAYDAIRVYLWAGMSGHEAQPLVERLRPFAALIRAAGGVPEKVDAASGEPLAGGLQPYGFEAAVLPFLLRVGEPALADQLRSQIHLARLRARVRGGAPYYDEALALFGEGWMDGWYRIDDSGRLHPRWEAQG